MQKKKIQSMLISSLAVFLLGQNLALPTVYGDPNESTAPASGIVGSWMTGEYHAHTYESNDAQESLTDVLDTAFEKNGLDWLALADHLRMSDRDDEGGSLPGGSIPMSQGIAAYQTPVIKNLQAAGKYAGKIIFSGFEWDMPQYDHAAVGIVTDKPGSDEALKAINHFEYLFTNRDARLFDPADVAAWNAADTRAYTDKADTRKGIQWISDHYPDSYVLINHPSRKNGGSSELKIADIRDFNNIDPEVVFGFEGMLGNQMSPDRGETAEVFGGTDVKVAKLGGIWDALLGEGRRFWNFANSDFHFKTSIDNKYSSGYWPGEYAKNYTWVEGSDIHAVVDGMRSGKSFSVFGDLINALEFNIAGDGRLKETGGELNVKQGDNLELTIRFKSPEKNNNGDPVQVDHVDLISGEVNGKIKPGTPEYEKPSNDTTKVLARFNRTDWTTDANGYHVITYKLGAADKNRYFRLRGTNLGTDVPGETSNGEPLLDIKNNTVDNLTRFKEINDRNYQDLWFYSNPIFVNVEPYSDDQAVGDTLAALQLGDTSAVTNDIKLPAEGKHGTIIDWTSSNSPLMTDDGKLAFRPKNDTQLTLTATIRRGTALEVKHFQIILKGDSSLNPLQLHSTLKTADGQPYTNGAWTNQNVTVSVYASVYVPGTVPSIQLSIDGKTSPELYPSNQAVDISEEGQHLLQFEATDTLGNISSRPIAVNIDRTAPVINLRGDKNISLKRGESFVDPGADITDMTGVPGPLIVTGEVNTLNAGTYTLHYNANDLAGNNAQEVARTVVVTTNNSGRGSNGNRGSGGGNISPPPTHPATSAEGPSTTQLELEVHAHQGATGTLTGILSFTIPADGLSADSKVRATVLTVDQTPSTGKLQALSPVLEITATNDGIIHKPMDLSLYYDVKKGIAGHKPAVYYYNEQQNKWVYIGGIDHLDGTIRVNVNRFSKIAVFNHQPLTFSDMDKHWAQTYINRLTGMNIMQGFENQRFRPNEVITRAQFASIIAKALGLQPSGNAVTFTDESDIPTWAAGDVAAAEQAGMIRGYEQEGKSYFRASQSITRAEMAVMLAHALKATLPNQVPDEVTFADQFGIPEWAQAGVNASIRAGILSGYEDHTFRPNQTATRAEAAAMVYKLLDALNM